MHVVMVGSRVRPVRRFSLRSMCPGKDTTQFDRVSTLKDLLPCPCFSSLGPGSSGYCSRAWVGVVISFPIFFGISSRK